MSLTRFGQVIRLSSMILFAFFDPCHWIKENALLKREFFPFKISCSIVNSVAAATIVKKKEDGPGPRSKARASRKKAIQDPLGIPSLFLKSGFRSQLEITAVFDVTVPIQSTITFFSDSSESGDLSPVLSSRLLQISEDPGRSKRQDSFLSPLKNRENPAREKENNG